MVSSLRARGAEVRIVELTTLNHEQLVDELRGVQVVISTLSPLETELQKALARASKDAGVTRFIPSDWGVACVPGVLFVYDLVSTHHRCLELILTRK